MNDDLFTFSIDKTIFILYSLNGIGRMKMKIDDLKSGTIVELIGVVAKDEATIAVFKGWTTGNSAGFPNMLFLDIATMVRGIKNAAVNIVDPMASSGEIRVLLEPEEQEEILKPVNYTAIRLFPKSEAVQEEMEERTISLPPSD